MNQGLILEQFDDLRSFYPELNLLCDDGVWFIEGTLNFSAQFAGEIIDDNYSILVCIPENYPDRIPIAFETAGRIPKNFHKLQSPEGALCLGEPIAVFRKFLGEPSLLGYVNNCLIPYLYSFSQKRRKGQLPFGELAHGTAGLIEQYLELFNLKNEKSLVGLIAILAKANYRGHVFCPCGSGKRLRSCHGDQLLEIMQFNSQGYFRNIYESLCHRVPNF